MPKSYSPDTRLHAKALWLTGHLTDAQIAEQLGITRPGTILDWRNEEKWDREREAIQKAADARVAQAISETIAEMNLRHLKEAQLLQTKGVQALKRLDPTRASEAAAMIEAGLKAERLIRGEPTEVREVRALMQANVQVLEVVVADVLKALLEAGQIDGRAARRFADVFAERINAAPFRYEVEGGGGP
jgi:transposase-like protein